MKNFARVRVKRLVVLKAQIASLQEEADALAASIKAEGPGLYSGGDLHEALVYESTTSTTDWRGLSETLSIPQRTIDRFTTKKPIVCLKLRIRS